MNIFSLSMMMATSCFLTLFAGFKIKSQLLFFWHGLFFPDCIFRCLFKGKMQLCFLDKSSHFFTHKPGWRSPVWPRYCLSFWINYYHVTVRSWLSISCVGNKGAKVFVDLCSQWFITSSCWQVAFYYHVSHCFAVWRFQPLLCHGKFSFTTFYQGNKLPHDFPYRDGIVWLKSKVKVELCSKAM